ncbi:MAG: putative membrane protein [Idiomarinaceae bacterium HL-53]|nr:MAG: putative membrane protein [Idiomarinaceae bacterium HL-53]CUS48702.1 membrane protein YqaA, SNARE-associated domain [Idiomarinaceae bacterium HL-53]
MNMLFEFGYVGLFLSAFLAATILPFSSEVVLSTLLIAELSPAWLIVSATAGNVLGSCANYGLGSSLRAPRVQTWLGISPRAFEQAETRFQRMGTWALLFAWVPVIGDPLTFVAGALRVNLVWFLILVSVGKLARYLVVSYLVLKTMA